MNEHPDLPRTAGRRTGDFAVTRRTAALALAGALALIIGLWELSGRGSLNPILQPAEAAAKEISVASAGTYVALRTINAALSAAQEVELGASFGVQTTLQPFKFLEPVDDMVERVADVIFAVAACAALAAVGFAPVAALGIMLFGLGLLALASSGLSPPLAKVMHFGRVATRFGAVLGFVMPLGFMLGVELGARLTEPQWQAAMAQLDAVAAAARMETGSQVSASDVEPEQSSGPQGLFDRLQGRLQTVGEGVGDAVKTVGRYSETASVFLSEADGLLNAMLVIIGVLALRMVVLPALLLWIFMILMRRSFEIDDARVTD